ncbi:MAG: hypothetical protein M3Z14_03505, partial [Candidatus Eremiobacteraeota bacterium]|nr:hypothetical protein [Candidatus Eremiobacteraeota bacterium]
MRRSAGWISLVRITLEVTALALATRLTASARRSTPSNPVPYFIREISDGDARHYCATVDNHA